MNGQTITAQDLLSEINLMEGSLSVLKKKILSFVPPKYGSDEWWDKMDEKAIESIKTSKGKKFDNYKEAIHYLNN